MCRSGGRCDLQAVNGEKTAEDAFFETRSQHYDIILFIHCLLASLIWTDQTSHNSRVLVSSSLPSFSHKSNLCRAGIALIIYQHCYLFPFSFFFFLSSFFKNKSEYITISSKMLCVSIRKSLRGFLFLYISCSVGMENDFVFPFTRELRSIYLLVIVRTSSVRVV